MGRELYLHGLLTSVATANMALVCLRWPALSCAARHTLRITPGGSPLPFRPCLDGDRLLEPSQPQTENERCPRSKESKYRMQTTNLILPPLLLRICQTPTWHVTSPQPQICFRNPTVLCLRHNKLGTAACLSIATELDASELAFAQVTVTTDVITTNRGGVNVMLWLTSLIESIVTVTSTIVLGVWSSSSAAK